jgi:hypothetical protein
MIRDQRLIGFFVGPIVHRLTRVGSRCALSLNLRNPSGHHTTQLRDLSATQLWLYVRIRPASYRRLPGLMADVGARPFAGAAVQSHVRRRC